MLQLLVFSDCLLNGHDLSFLHGIVDDLFGLIRNVLHAGLHWRLLDWRLVVDRWRNDDAGVGVSRSDDSLRGGSGSNSSHVVSVACHVHAGRLVASHHRGDIGCGEPLIVGRASSCSSRVGFSSRGIVWIVEVIVVLWRRDIRRADAYDVLVVVVCVVGVIVALVALIALVHLSILIFDRLRQDWI